MDTAHTNILKRGSAARRTSVRLGSPVRRGTQAAPLGMHNLRPPAVTYAVQSESKNKRPRTLILVHENLR